MANHHPDEGLPEPVRHRSEPALTEQLCHALAAELAQPGAMPRGWLITEVADDQGPTVLAQSEGEHLAIALDRFDATRPCYARTERFNLWYSSVGRGSAVLSADGRDALDAVVAALRRIEPTLPLVAAGEVGRAARLRTLTVTRALFRESPGVYWFNPYIGCTIGCPVCNSVDRAEFSRVFDGLAREPWGRWVDVKANAPAVLATELRHLAPGWVRFCPIVADPYQPAERRFRITRQALTAMVGTGFVPILLSRCGLLLEDLDLIRQFPEALVGFSVPTDDDRVRATFEPGADPIETRIAALATLRAAGVRTYAILQPMLPMNPERLVELLAPHVQAVVIGPLQERERAAPLYREAGYEACLDPDWDRALFSRLAARFSALGIPVNSADEPWRLLTA